MVIAVAGDVLPESSWEAPHEIEHLFDGVREEFARADLVFVNLEEPLTGSSKVTPYKNPAAVAAGRDYVLSSRNPEVPRILKEAGIGLVGLANNHMLDYTEEGLDETLRRLAEAGPPWVGAGRKSEAERAYVFSRRGRRVALLAFSDVIPTNYEATETHHGIASSKEEEDLRRAIEQARQRADYVVLMMHWGGQGKHLITPRQRQLGQVAAEAGCDAVIGMHPHVLQGVEYVGRVPVFYSVGNFAFPSSSSPARECVLVKLAFGPGGLEEVKVVPVEISPAGAPQLARGEQGRKILAQLDGFCRMFNTALQDGKLIRGPVRERLVYDTASGRLRARSRRVNGHRAGRRVSRVGESRLRAVSGRRASMEN